MSRLLAVGLVDPDLFERAPTHAPGRVVRDLAVMLADGGDALCDLGVVREQEALFGPVASDATAYRLIERIAGDPVALERLRAARAQARARAFRRGARARLIEIDLDATLLGAHSDKEGAAGTFKGGFGFHPMLAYLDGTEQALAGVLRPGNAGANTAADQIAVLDAALAQLPQRVAARESILVRADSAGATRELLEFCRDGRLRFRSALTSPSPFGRRSSRSTSRRGGRRSSKTASPATTTQPRSPRSPTCWICPAGRPAPACWCAASVRIPARS